MLSQLLHDEIGNQKLYYVERKGKRELLGFVLQICFSIPQLALYIFDYKNKLTCPTSA